MSFKTHNPGAGFRIDNRHKMYDEGAKRDPVKHAIKTFRSSGRWQKVQRAQVREHFLCYDPFQIHHAHDLPAPAESVHHVIGLLECHRLGVLTRLGCVPDNLRSLCNACHAKVEGILDNSGETAAKRIFINEEQEQAIKALVL